jgi:hypothetical protein
MDEICGFDAAGSLLRPKQRLDPAGSVLSIEPVKSGDPGESLLEQGLVACQPDSSLGLEPDQDLTRGVSESRQGIPLCLGMAYRRRKLTDQEQEYSQASR